MDRPRNMKVGEDATLVRQLAAQAGAIFALDWSPDGTRVAVAGAGPSVNIYAADTGLPLASCKGHAAGIYAVAFSPDSAHVATGGFDGQVRLYSTNDCALEKSFVPVPLEARPNKAQNGLLVGALRARCLEFNGVFAGEAGLLGACSGFSDTLLDGGAQ